MRAVNGPEPRDRPATRELDTESPSVLLIPEKLIQTTEHFPRFMTPTFHPRPGPHRRLRGRLGSKPRLPAPNAQQMNVASEDGSETDCGESNDSSYDNLAEEYICRERVRRNRGHAPSLR